MSSEPDDLDSGEAKTLGSRLWAGAKRVGWGVSSVVFALAESYAAYMEMPAPCDACRREFPRKTMRHLPDVPAYASRWYLTFCADCQDRLRTAYRYQGFQRDENRKLLVQLKRAIDAGLPATLTLEQWIATLKFYQGRCAYCRVGPYEAIEHFIPLTLGGGTTADNCVPACKTCNSSKGVRHPDSIGETSRAPTAIARVRNDFVSRNLTHPFEDA